MFLKIKNKKGMTLIEMMAVIAIIAVLVSIVVPTISNATTKANAATNAANLRNVAGQVATLKVTNPEIFEASNNINAAVNEAADYANERLDDFYEMLDYVESNPDIANIADFILKTVFQFNSGLSGLRSIIIETENYVDTLNYKYGICQTFYADDGIITIGDMTITAPTSKSVSLKDMEIPKGTEMVLVINENQIYASYEGITADGFGILAQNGAETNSSDITHNFRDSNNNGECDLCGGSGGTDNCVKNESTEMDDLFGQGHTCSTTDSDKDHECDDPDCTLWINVHTDATGDGNHICDHPDCNEVATECTLVKGESGYYCSECKTPHVCDHGSRGRDRCPCENQRKNNCGGCD